MCPWRLIEDGVRLVSLRKLRGQLPVAFLVQASYHRWLAAAGSSAPSRPPRPAARPAPEARTSRRPAAHLAPHPWAWGVPNLPYPKTNYVAIIVLILYCVYSSTIRYRYIQYISVFLFS